MSTLYVFLFAIGLCLEACAIVYLWRLARGRPAEAARSELHTGSYNMGVRDAYEVVRDVRIECGVSTGENAMLEEAFGRMGKLYK